MTAMLTRRAAAKTTAEAIRFTPTDCEMRIEPVSDGDGHTVTAYAAAFGVDQSIKDTEGEYIERIAPTSFAKTIADRGTRFKVLFNHGMTIHGQSSERYSMPIGRCLEIGPDSYGLLTRTKYSRTDLAEEVLANIENGAITGQSFTGRMISSSPGRPISGRYRARNGSLPVVTRQEIALSEYGPVTFPYYEAATIVGIRSMLDPASPDAAMLSLLLQALLANLAEGDRALDPIVNALTKADLALDQAQAVISGILGVPNPDEDAAVGDELRSMALKRLEALTVRIAQSGQALSPTSIIEAGTGEPGSAHSGRTVTRYDLRARLIKDGLI